MTMHYINLLFTYLLTSHTFASVTESVIR